jgi:peptidoglycan/LPS O-acetylase OafA/YrhL
LLRLRPVAFIGTLSYGMYLLNSVAIHAVHFVVARLGSEYPPLVFVLALAFAVAIAYLSYRYYESPFLRLKTRFSRLRPLAGQSVGAQVPGAKAPATLHP